mmetsp:Transcript_11874/g.17332  ORF Transcript_11874/g.17332 Transcript_11874/m.17332 type:complete len:194 (+) Transcript_11874:163-744(+)
MLQIDGYSDGMMHDDDEDQENGHQRHQDNSLNRKRALTAFHGWSRMGLELTSPTDDEYDSPVRLLKVSPPKLGERIPLSVLTEITLNLKHCGEHIRKNEWDSVGEFDNLFLIGVDAAAMDGGPAPFANDAGDDEKRIPDEEDATFPKRFGIVVVRGCMVLEVRDGEGDIMTDPTSKHCTRRESKRLRRSLHVG